MGDRKFGGTQPIAVATIGEQVHFGGNLGLLQRLVVVPRILYFLRIVFRLDQEAGWRQRDRFHFRRQGMGIVQLQIGGIDVQREVWPRIPADQLGRRLSRREEDEILGYGPEGV